MEFSYTISEADYLSALKLRFKRIARTGIVFAALICVSVVLLLVVLFFSIALHNPGHTMKALFMVLVLGVLYAGAWIDPIFGLLPMRPRTMYRKSPTAQGKFTVDITPDSISAVNTAGVSSKSAWTLYDHRCEGNGVIVPQSRSGGSFLLGLASLSEPQQMELRGILAAVLPRE
jgi:hypothetical protein